MLDTGALFPVWVAKEERLEKLGAVPVAFEQAFGGFGGTAKGTIYRIPLFRLGELEFPCLPVIAASASLPCQMLISATMFSSLSYEIDDRQHLLNVTIPDDESISRQLRIEDSHGRLHVLCTGKESGRRDKEKSFNLLESMFPT